MESMIYKIESVEPSSAAEYAIRCNDDQSGAFAKTKGSKEFSTDLQRNNTGYEVFLSGREVTKEEYDSF